MTATLRALDSVHALPLLSQALRLHHEHLLIHPDQMLVVIPGAGTVLVTEDARRMTFDVVAESRADFELRRAALEASIHRHIPGVRTVVEWTQAASIPVPFR